MRQGAFSSQRNIERRSRSHPVTTSDRVRKRDEWTRGWFLRGFRPKGARVLKASVYSVRTRFVHTRRKLGAGEKVFETCREVISYFIVEFNSTQKLYKSHTTFHSISEYLMLCNPTYTYSRLSVYVGNQSYKFWLKIKNCICLTLQSFFSVTRWVVGMLECFARMKL